MATRVAEAKVRIEGESAVIDLAGDINGAAQGALTEAYTQVSSAGVKSLLLNFADTEFINSTGIAVIVGILAKARQEQRKVSACGLTEHYQHIFEITRLSDFMPIYADEKAARTQNG